MNDAALCDAITETCGNTGLPQPEENNTRITTPRMGGSCLQEIPGDSRNAASPTLLVTQRQ